MCVNDLRIFVSKGYISIIYVCQLAWLTIRVVIDLAPRTWMTWFKSMQAMSKCKQLSNYWITCELIQEKILNSIIEENRMIFHSFIAKRGVYFIENMIYKSKNSDIQLSKHGLYILVWCRRKSVALLKYDVMYIMW